MEVVKSVNNENNIKPKKVYSYDKERKKELMRAYYQNNKDVKITCEGCGKIYSIFNRAHHQTSKYHLNVIEYLKNKNQ
jgi:hypothetical protein